MKERRHHNNDGRRQIQRGKTRTFIKRLARKLGVPYGKKACQSHSLLAKVPGKPPQTA